MISIRHIFYLLILVLNGIQQIDAQNLNLSQPVSYNGGAIPVAFAVGDLNADGNPDVAVLNRQGHLRIYQNNGNGCFTSMHEFPQLWPTTTDGTWPGFPSMADIEVTDVTGDGLNDVVATWGEHGGIVSVVKNRGGFAFDPTSNFKACGYVSYLTSADLNGDSAIDIAVTGTCFNATVLLNNGNGAFTSNGSFGQGYTSAELASADLNGDLQNDLAFLNIGISNVSLLFNNGNGTFANQSGYSTGDNPHDLVLTDLDNDNDADMAIANFYSNNVSLFYNDGLGAFPVRKTAPAGGGPEGIAAGDLNNDRFVDLLVVNRNTNNLSLLQNQGNGSFVETRIGAGIKPADVAVADLNRDGKKDVLALNQFSETLGVYLNQAPACPAPPASATPNKIIVPFSAKGVISNRQRLVSLNWSSDVRSDSIVVFRNGRKFLTTINDGYQWDDVSRIKGQTFKYRICELAPFDSCSTEITVSF